jgi:Protein of unknown function (DUF1566)
MRVCLSIFATISFGAALLGSLPVTVALAPAASAAPYVKICNSGDQAGSGVCPASPNQGAASNQWACTLDSATNLMWEVKTPANGGIPTSAEKFFTNYDSISSPQKSNGAMPMQIEIDAPTNAAGYKNYTNAKALCGKTIWRVPTLTELQSIVSGTTIYTIDTTYFPNMVYAPFYWTSTATTGTVSTPNAQFAEVIDFQTGAQRSWKRALQVNGALRLVAQGTAQQCQTLAVDESNPWLPAGKITLPGSPKTLFSITGSYTVAAAIGLPSETKSILNPPPAQPNQRKAGPYPLSLSNKYINIFMLPNPTSLPPISQSGAANYVTMNQALVTGSYLVPGMSVWPDGTIHAHGNITGTVMLCVQ